MWKRLTFGQKLVVIKVSSIIFLILLALSIPAAILSALDGISGDVEIENDNFTPAIADFSDSAGEFRYEDYEKYFPKEDDEKIMEDFAAYQAALRNRVKYVKERIKERQNEIKTEIERKKGALENILTTRYSREEYDQFYPVVDISITEITDIDALKLICLHSVQYEESALSSTGDLLRYVGRPAENPRGTISIPISDTGVTATVSKWGGTFLPQYLIEQQRQMIDEFGYNPAPIKGDAAADLLIIVTCSDLSHTYVSTTTQKVKKMVETPLLDEDGNMILDGYGSPVMQRELEEVEETVATAVFTIVIGVRSVDELAEAAGLIDSFE